MYANFKATYQPMQRASQKRPPRQRFSLLTSLCVCVAVGCVWAIFAPPGWAREAVDELSIEQDHVLELSLAEGKYQITIDSSASPELTPWAAQQLAPVVSDWYPLLVQMLPSPGFEAPTQVRIELSDEVGGVAYTSGTRVVCNGNWFKRELQGEALGAVVHELVHVVQQYGAPRRSEGRRSRPPGWLVEGIPDYIRWFLYEPESRGAILAGRAAERAEHDASYRVSANFLNWAANQYGNSLIVKLNGQLRTGSYQVEFWEDFTGKSLSELAASWKASLQPSAPATEAEEPQNRLTPAEVDAGWRLLFDGQSLAGWHTFGRDEPLPGWKVADGVLHCADPSQAGDLCTEETFAWFELSLEYNIAQGGNSGILYHVSSEGPATWASGPEFQLEDNMEARDPVRCGWLYALYEPPVDDDTGRPIDATLPAGQWNKVRLLVSPSSCVHEINGVKYLEYQLGSEDFQRRVAASKFARMPLFAQRPAGLIALQGDHGRVSFRNIKVRPLAPQ